MLAETTYNWDDIQVGRSDLNHSENFFTQKHCKHEKVTEEFDFLQAMAASNANESFSNEIAIECTENKENTKPTAQIKIENLISNDQLLSPAKDQVKHEMSKQVSVAVTTPPSPSTSKTNRRPANLMTKFKIEKPQVKSNCPAPPHAYDFKDIYKKKKEEAMRKLMEEEKKNRVFHSRPVPKSAPMRKTQVEYLLTVPKTPTVLKNSKEADAKRKQRLEEYKKKNAPPKFTSREAHVLQEEPFRPKKIGQTIQPQPFKLNVERRLEERKQYDEQNRLAAEEKKKQEEEERKKREEELVKELRKLASFKARPNPFK